MPPSTIGHARERLAAEVRVDDASRGSGRSPVRPPGEYWSSRAHLLLRGEPVEHRVEVAGA